jgi:hypothetical protein
MRFERHWLGLNDIEVEGAATAAMATVAVVVAVALAVVIGDRYTHSVWLTIFRAHTLSRKPPAEPGQRHPVPDREPCGAE